jgi:proteasome accessory factor C
MPASSQHEKPTIRKKGEGSNIEQAKILRVFKLLDLLLQAGGCSVEELGEELGQNPRTVYRYLRLVGEEGLGYRVEQRQGRYRITDTGRYDRNWDFTAEEYELLQQRLAPVGPPDPVLQTLRRRLRLAAGYVPRPDQLPALQHLTWAGLLREALRTGRQVLLPAYRSTNTADVRDRLVEPLHLTPDLVLRAWEVETRIEKSFRVERMGGAPVLAGPLTARTAERLPDLFGMAETDWQPVELLLTDRAHALLLREFADAHHCCTPAGEAGWPRRFQGQVRGFEGVGRFVLGLPTEVRVLSPDALRDYVRERSSRATW